MALIIDGDARTFRAAAYGRPAESTVRFLRQQFEDPTESMRFAGSRFFQGARELFEQSYSEEALERIDAVRRNLARTWNLDEIHELNSLEEIQNAKPIMRRFMMANPAARRLFQAGRIEGYGEHYLDHSPKDIGRDHYDYRMVMSGMIVESETHDWEATTYMDELLEGDTELTFQQRCDILNSWNQMEMELLFGDRDPTSMQNNKWR